MVQTCGIILLAMKVGGGAMGFGNRFVMLGGFDV